MQADDNRVTVLVSERLWNRRQFLQRSSAAAVAVAAPTLLMSSAPVRFINYIDWIGKGEFAAFRKATGITVQQIVVNQDEGRIAKLAADPNAADMALLDLTDTGRVNALGLLGQIRQSHVPNYKFVEPQYRVGPFSTYASQGIATDFGRVGYVYRTDLVKEDLKSWADLWRVAPKYSGKISFLDLEADTLTTALLYLGYNANSHNPTEIGKAGDALIRIKPFLQALVTADMLTPLLNGSGAIAMDWDYDAYGVMLKNPHVPLKWVDPAEGMYAYLDGWCAIKTTKVLASVEAFMNFHLSPKVYASFVNAQGTAYVEAAAKPYIMPAIAHSPVLFPAADVRARIHFGQFVGTAQKYWDQAWERFKSA